MADKILEKLPGAKKNVLLKDYTTFKIGGPARYFFIAKNKEDLIRALKTAKELKLPFFVLGGGSNLLVSDKGFSGLVIKIDISGMKLEENKIFAGAGTALAKLAYFSAKNGFSGLEWAAGIPEATVGGALFGHAQAFGSKISDLIKEVEALDLKTFKIKKFSIKQCQFSLKSSIFKKNKNLIITSAIFGLEKDDKEKIKEKLKEFLDYRKSHHPMAFPSAGSVFVNPEKNGQTIRVASLVEQCGLKGKKKGKSQISEKHANFIINLGNARAQDVLALMNLAKKKVKEKFGINLETEIQFLGF